MPSTIQRWMGGALSVILVGLCLLVIPGLASAQPVPGVSFNNLRPDPFIGEEITFEVVLDNTSLTDTGYGPYIDLRLPTIGADGAGAGVDDGVTFLGATYLGASVTSTLLTFDGAGNATHPYAKTVGGTPLIITGTPGNQVAVLQLPFGSFTPTQPAAAVQVRLMLSNRADLGIALALQAQGGFQYGADALDNPTTDPTITGTLQSSNITPTLMRLKKTYLGPEDETATGPNFPREYLIEVDIANGQTLTDVTLMDVLPSNMQYMSVTSTTIRGAPQATTAVSTPSTTTPGGNLRRRFASVTGTTAENDATLQFQFYIPRVDASTTVIINPNTGDDVDSDNDARASAQWTPIDPGDSQTPVTSDAVVIDHKLTDKSIAIQKSASIVTDNGAPGATPGDVVEYTLNIQVSDYFAFQSVAVTDVIGDGLRRDATFLPTLAASRHGTPTTGAMDAGSYTFTVDSPGLGTTTALFDVWNDLQTRTGAGELLGGCVPLGGTGGPPPDCALFNGGGTTVTIVYRAIIQENYTDNFPSNDPSVDAGDVMNNTVSVSGSLLNVANLAPSGQNEVDGSAADLIIVSGQLTKAVYAVNGNTSFPTPIKIMPGDTVTYQLRLTLPTSDIEPFQLTDYLPLPIFHAMTMAPTFNATQSATPPAAGQAQFGPGDTFYALTSLVPTITRDATGNSVAFEYPQYDSPSSPSSTIEILFTVQASNDPFADRLFLTNQVRSSEKTTQNETSTKDAIVQVELTEPVLAIRKGVVATNNAGGTFTPSSVGPVTFNAPGTLTQRWSGGPVTSTTLGTAPIDSNLAGVDVGDLVTFAVVIQNTGSSAAGAFDVTLRDTMPTGFAVPGGGLNLQVRNGAGTLLTYTTTGSGLFDPAGGIRLDDGATGSLASGTVTDGTNILILTYDLEIQSGVTAAQVLTNTATLFNYAGTEGGPDHTTTDKTDTATVTIKTPTLTKTVESTNQAHTSGNSVAIGEIVTYRITVTVPEGVTNNAILTDTFPLGLAMLDVTAVNPSAGVTVGTLPTVGAGTSLPVGAGADNAGRQVVWNLGTITNSNNDNSVADTITIDLRAVVTNVAANQSGQNRANAVGLTFTGGTTSANAPNVTIVEPVLTFAKSAVPTSGDAGDVITFNVSVTNTSGVNAFDVTLADALPSGLTLVGGSVSPTLSGGVTGSVSETANGFTAILPVFPNGGSVTVSLSATLDASIVSGQVLTNSITGNWTSLPGVVTTTQSTHNTLATERTGMPADPGGAVNDYAGSANASVTAVAPVPTKTVVTTNLADTTGNNLAVGEQVQYQVQVAVPEGTATGVSLVDTLPVGMVFQSLDSIVASAGVTASAGTFPAILSAAAITNSGRTVTFTLGTVTNGNSNPATETVTFVYTAVATNAAANQRGTTLVNNAVWNFNGDNASVNGPTMTIVEPTLQIDKTVTPTTADAGDTVTYQLTISHAAGSNAAAYDVTLSDVLPAGVTFVGGSLSPFSGVAPASLTEAGGTISATYTSIAVGQSSVIRFQATTNGMPTPVTPGQTISNSASIRWTSLPGDVTTAQSSHSAVSTERTGNTGNPGGVVNDYTASDSVDLTIHTSSISGYVYVDANNDGGRTGGEAGINGVTVRLTGTDHLGNTIDIVTTTGPTGAYTFTGLRPGTYRVTELQPAGYEDGRESVGTPALGATAGNDTIGTITIPAGANTTAIDFNFGELTTADLSVTKSGAPHSVAPGANITYAIEVKNLGPLTATNATLTDVLPGGTTFVSLTSAPGWTCTPPGVGTHGTLSCTIASLPVGTSTFTLVVQAGPTLVAGSQLRNVATITATSADTNPFNNKDDEPTIVAAATEADLEVTKTDAVDPVTAGQSIVYTLTVRNHGPATSDVTVTDTLPAGLTLVSAVPVTGTCGTGNPFTCDIPALAAGNSTTITVTASTSTPGVFTNSVTVASANGVVDPNPTNNQAEEPTTVVDVAGTDVAIKKIGPPTVARGGTLSYTLQVTNRGTIAADNVEVADPLSLPGLSFLGNTGACTTAFPCALGTLAPGATVTIVSTFAVDPAYSGPNPVVNVATVSTTTPDADPTNNTSTVNTLVADPTAADLTIVKVDSPDAAVAGTAITYTLVVTNNGPGTAIDATVTDTLPAGVTVTGTSASQGSCSGSGPVTCNLGTIAPGALATIGITVQTASALPTPNPIMNNAEVTSTSADPEPSNNTTTQPTTIIARADVTVTKTGAATVLAGNNIAYTLTVTNNGPSDALNVSVADPTPSGITFVSNAGDCTTAFPCALGTLAAGASRTITATYAVPSSTPALTTITNTATVSTDTTETNTNNNTDDQVTTVNHDADLAITKTGPATVSAGNQISYTLTITNNGPSDAAGVTVADPTPSGLTFVSNTGDCTTAFPCALGAMANGATRTITATYLVPSGHTSTPIVNTATVSSSTPDSNSTNDSASATTTLGAPSADLSVTKTGPATAIPGNQIAFTIVVHNAGPADADGVSLADPTPTGLTFVSNAGDCTTAFPCALGTIAAGASRTITATYLVPNGYTTPDPIVNTATVSSTTADPDPSNNTDSAEVSVGADLVLTKTATPEPVAAGSNLTFTIVATNNGARDAVDLVINDTIPAGTTFVSASASTGGSCTTPSVGGSGAVACSWPGVTVAAETRTLILVVRVDASTPAGTVITNTAVTSSSTNDPNPTNNTDTSTSNVVTAADIVITKVVDNPSPNVGDEVTYTVTARNDGPSHATGVAVTDALPPSLVLVQSAPSQGTYDAPSGLWTVGALEVGAAATLQLRVRVTDDGPATNTATKTAGDQLDPDPSNNTAAATLTSNPVADVRVQKTADATAANVASTVTFTIVAANAGPSDATGVRIVDALPAGLTFVSAAATSGSFNEATSTWELGTLALDAQATLTLTATVNAAGPIVNEARKTAQNELDPNPANDASGATVNGLAADIQVVKTVAASSDVRVGQQVVFYITATNNGPSAATGVRVRDALPSGLAYVSSSATRGVYVPQTGVWDIGPLAATGADATATLELRAVVLTHDSIVNRAVLMSVDQTDGNPLNNESSVTLVAPTIDLADKITTPHNYSAVGTIADFYVEVTNVGATTSVSPLTLAIPLPPEYDYVPTPQPDWTCTQVGRTLFCQNAIALPRARGVTLKLPMRVNAPLPWGRSIFAHLTTPRDSVSPNNVTQLYLGLPPEPDPNMAAAQTVTVTGSGATRTLTYSILVDNHGPLPAFNAVLTDVLPANTTLVSASSPVGACDVSGSFVNCGLGTLEPGHAVYVTVVLTAPAPGAVTHTVSVSSDQFDEYPRDNQSVLTTRLDVLQDRDTDTDGMTDEWESLMGLSVATNDATGDADGDGVSNADEYARGTHPRGTESRYFAEGASNDFFYTTLSVFNPDRAAFASVMIELLQPDGTIVSAPRLLAPLGRVELDPRTLLPAGGTFSVLVESDRAVAVERDMRWDRSGYGSTGESGAPSASTAWYFAEGATGPFSLFYLIENPSMTQSANVRISYLLSSGQPPVVTTQTLAPHSRETIFVNSLADANPSLRGAEIAATIESTNAVPIVAERAMYLEVPGQMMGAGHAGLGAPAPSTSWFFAEGATGAFFNEYVLLANPNATQTAVTVKYLLPDGTSFEKPYNLLPLSRQTIDVAGQDPRLAATSVAATVTSTLPIVAERVMWWPGRTLSPTWYEAHASLGATTTGLRWAIAGGASAGPFANRTYALVANQETRAGQAKVTVSFDDGTTIERTLDLPATSRTTIDFGVQFPETENRHFSAVIDSIGATPVPVVVEWSRYGSPGGQFWGSGSAALATKVQ